MKISLCITCYDKDHKYLYELLPLFEQQTVLPDETLVICSGAQHLDIQTSLPIFNIVYSHKRKNAAWARNHGAKYAIFDYIMFFDVDDIPHHQKIEVTKNFIKDNDFLLHSFIERKDRQSQKQLPIQQNQLITSNSFTLPTKKHLTNIECENYNIHHAHLTVKTDIVRKIGFDESRCKARKEDSLFCQELIKQQYKGIFIDYPLVEYMT